MPNNARTNERERFMKLSPDDPRLTAYALDELDSNERAVVEAALVDAPEMRVIVEEIRAAAGLLETELATELAPGLHQAQREAIEASVESKLVAFPWPRVFRPALM